MRSNSMCHNFKTTLYHGTVSEIQHVDVNLGRELKVIDWR